MVGLFWLPFLSIHLNARFHINRASTSQDISLVFHPNHNLLQHYLPITLYAPCFYMEYTTSDRGYHLPPLDFSITNPTLCSQNLQSIFSLSKHNLCQGMFEHTHRLSTSNPLSSYNQPSSSYFVSPLPTPPFAATRPPC
ncbi:hypothetical protein BX661DRAFT_37245 [Kickxella alabastrina]|uniref:uncharacterized protein n=1 Tax=Kickxella alabastrina TaxID=61397 RepID=UPI002220AA9B|nr:uncharacterized protein BX661DRAFT_37245 [Kickxella alabastrina]KAI7818121.1 hypothetical protein BX661DRAFT_37245 [Kickxella alabastrina]